eukprot:CAMPEP_0202431018 /NCGR_PEP_ID=MMETSP1345-20130828/4396_1 /ASSEMBLY_ACC=CAM_ASM_000843 /TAXON_ID=342563 /ORGANISM="Fabrea Fabrea salina" /LENGTH=148 /DNA_ID=CAMNT_0049042601 /DNA_START=150 /DNA_END=596 /DNA_ORIENTATION=+
MNYLRKRKNTQPKKGPFHQRSPSMMFFKAVRGMVPRKTARGEAALARLSVFDGVPHPYDTKKKMVVPDALRVARLQPGRKFTVLGELAQKVGWKKKAVIERLEKERKERSEAWYQKKLDDQKQKEEVEERLKGSALGPVLETLKELGH